MLVIKFLYPGLPEAIAKFVTGFRKGLGELGYVDGQNVAIEYRWGSRFAPLFQILCQRVRATGPLTRFQFRGDQQSSSPAPAHDPNPVALSISSYQGLGTRSLL
jgi:hypothetical protein